MRLHQHIAELKISMAAWGRACNVPDRSTARRYVNGMRVPPPEVIVRTYLWSGGQVTPNDFYDLPALPEGTDPDTRVGSQEAA